MSYLCTLYADKCDFLNSCQFIERLIRLCDECTDVCFNLMFDQHTASVRNETSLNFNSFEQDNRRAQTYHRSRSATFSRRAGLALTETDRDSDTDILIYVMVEGNVWRSYFCPNGSRLSFSPVETGIALHTPQINTFSHAVCSSIMHYHSIKARHHRLNRCFFMHWSVSSSILLQKIIITYLIKLFIWLHFI